jgi:predicted double-glycine peptidase
LHPPVVEDLETPIIIDQSLDKSCGALAIVSLLNRSETDSEARASGYDRGKKEMQKDP